MLKLKGNVLPALFLYFWEKPEGKLRQWHFPTPFPVIIFLKIIARCQIYRLKYTRLNFGLGSTPDPAGRVYDAPPNALPRHYPLNAFGVSISHLLVGVHHFFFHNLSTGVRVWIGVTIRFVWTKQPCHALTIFCLLLSPSSLHCQLAGVASAVAWG